MIWYLLILQQPLLAPIDFNSQAACEAARVRIMAVYDRKTICVFKGDGK
jgi:hypothetical protein